MITNTQEEVNVDDLSTAELRRLSEQSMSEELPEPDNTERKRDENGRFVAQESHTNTVEDPDELEDEPEVTLYRKEIDLGDGSGVQVFTAKSIDELVDKLADAQANATKKIRELNNRLKATETAKPADAEPNPDDEFVLGQQLATNPTKTMQKLIDKELARRESEQKGRAEREAAIAQDFINRNPDYLANQTNGNRIFKYLQTYKLDPTVENLETAYTELNQSGLLEVRTAASEEEGVTEDADTTTDTGRIDQTEARPKVTEPIQRKKAASGLSSRGTTSRPIKPTGPTEEELSKLSTEQLRELAVKATLRS